MFGKVFGDRWYTGMLNGYFVERFEAVDDAEAAVLLEDTEPMGAVRRAAAVVRIIQYVPVLCLERFTKKTGRVRIVIRSPGRLSGSYLL